MFETDSKKEHSPNFNILQAGRNAYGSTSQSYNSLLDFFPELFRKVHKAVSELKNFSFSLPILAHVEIADIKRYHSPSTHSLHESDSSSTVPGS